MTHTAKLTVFLSILLFTHDALGQRGRGRGGFARGASAGHFAGTPRGTYRSTPVLGPQGGYGTRTSVRTPVMPTYAGGTRQAGRTSGSYTTPRGTTIDYGAAGRGGTTARGTQYGRGVGGVQVTTPTGQTATKVGRAGGAVGPGGVAVGGRSSAARATGPGGSASQVSGSRTVAGPGGSMSRSYRGGVAVGPNGAVAGKSRAAVRTGPGGTVAAGSRGRVAVGPYGSSAAASRTVAGRTRYGTYYRSSAAFAAQGSVVRRNFRYYNTFTPGWYAKYPGAWFAAGWAAGRVWSAATWGTVSSYCGYPAQPAYYDYGSTVVYEGDSVYIDGESVGTTEEYAASAIEIADAGRNSQPPQEESWQPLGVFAMVRDDEETSDKIFQLAVSKDGVIRGNYYDAIADNTLPVYGSVDPQTQRAAWSIGEKKEIVYEAGIANLTRDEAPVLVHFGENRTEQFTFVRVQQPEDASNQQP